jgi:hypothetical protein
MYRGYHSSVTSLTTIRQRSNVSWLPYVKYEEKLKQPRDEFDVEWIAQENAFQEKIETLQGEVDRKTKMMRELDSHKEETEARFSKAMRSTFVDAIYCLHGEAVFRVPEPWGRESRRSLIPKLNWSRKPD